MRNIPFLITAVLCLSNSALGSSIELPEPSGPEPIGTSVYYLTRPEASDTVRQLTVQAWFPARDNRVGSPAPYLTDWELAERATTTAYYFQTPEQLASWTRLVTHSHWGSQPKETEEGLPVVLFSPGLGVIRANYTSLTEELASQGYAVFLIEPPQEGTARLGSGHLAGTRVSNSLDEDREEPDWSVVESDWATDLRFALDWLTDQSLPWHDRVDLDRVAAVGHSMGGAAAFEACRLDERFRACINLDGLSFGSAVSEGVARPSLFLKSQPQYSAEEIAERGMTREAWERRGEEMKATAQGPIANSTAVGYYVEMLGTGHMSFSDAPWVMPNTITHFGGDLLPMPTSHEILTAILRSFLDEFVLGEVGAFDKELSRKALRQVLPQPKRLLPPGP